MNTLGYDIENWQKDGFYTIFNSTKDKFVMHPINDRKLFMCYIDAVGFINDNKNNGQVYKLVKA